MVDVDIRTRVELKNETQRTRAKKGVAGKVALIGAFPSSKQEPFAAENYGQIVSHYGIKANSIDEKWYNGVRAAKRIFMEGMTEFSGASSITCINICKYKPTDLTSDLEGLEELYCETYPESEIGWSIQEDVAQNSGIINSPTGNYERIHTPTNSTIAEDVKLTFDKLQKALNSIADEDMDMLFIANDLWEIFDSDMASSKSIHPLAQPVTVQEKDDNGVWHDKTEGDKTVTGVIIGYNYPEDENADPEPIYYEPTKNGYDYRRFVVNKNTNAPVLQAYRKDDGTYDVSLKPPFVTTRYVRYLGKSTAYADKGYWKGSDDVFREPLVVELEEHKAFTLRAIGKVDGVSQILTTTSSSGKTKDVVVKGEYTVITIHKLDDTNLESTVRYIGGITAPQGKTNVFGHSNPSNVDSNTTYGGEWHYWYQIINRKIKDGKINDNGTAEDLIWVDSKAAITTTPDWVFVTDRSTTSNSTDLLKITANTGLKSNEEIAYRFFDKTAYQIASGGTPQFYMNPHIVNYLLLDETKGKVDWQIPLMEDSQGFTIYGQADSGRIIRNIGDLYDFVLDFVDNEFTNHRPVNYIGAVKTRAQPEGKSVNVGFNGIPSEQIRVNGVHYNYESESDMALRKKYTPTKGNPYADIVEWGAVDIANLFTRTTNELSTCGLFYQGGIVNGEEVDAMELSAHICGWLCSIPLNQDLTYQTIPKLTSISEEPFFGENDAGKLLNEAGIQVIKPKNRLERTFYVNNAIQPTGWHTNHIRVVTYLLKQLQFESGLGINNFTSNIEAYRASLEATANEVKDTYDLIRSVEIGDVQVLSHYHIYVPVTIVLSGVVTLISVGVSMALDEQGNVGTYIKTTSGYSISV